MICGSQGIGDVLLIADAVPTVFGLPVDGVAGDAEYRLLLHQRDMVAPCAILGVDAVVRIDQGRMPMLLSAEGSGHIFRAVHDAATLAVEAQNGWHAVSTGAALERWGNIFTVADASGRPSGARGESGCQNTGGSLSTHPVRRMEPGLDFQRLGPLPGKRLSSGLRS